MSDTKTLLAGVVRRLCVLAVAAGAASVGAAGQGSLVANSPFMPSGGAAAAGSGPGEPYELSGSSVQGSEVSVCIYERQAKHSQWIPVGGLVDGIHVISFDAEHDRAVVTISGSYRELSMRKATVAPAGAPVALRAAPAAGDVALQLPPAAPAPLPSPATAQHDQQEARMLVSDLLEIGVQQRKAYQEARQKAAQEAAAQPTK